MVRMHQSLQAKPAHIDFHVDTNQKATTVVDNCRRSKRAFFLATLDDRGYMSVHKSDNFQLDNEDSLQDPIVKLINTRFLRVRKENDENFPRETSSFMEIPQMSDPVMEYYLQHTPVTSMPATHGQFASMGNRISLNVRRNIRGQAIDYAQQRHEMHEVDAVDIDHDYYKSEDDATSPDHEPIPRQLVMQSFQIQDAEKVKDFFLSKLDSLQQMAVKRIAKAWIRGICPRKQAKFPYNNKVREEKNKMTPLVPKWWPDSKTVCPFTEPDHVKKHQRRALMLHLLRLRPTTQQLKAWNNEGGPKNPHDDKHDPNGTHKLRGWSAFLKEIAPVSILDGLPHETEERAKRRRLDLQQLYEVAEMEEMFLDHGVGGETYFSHIPSDVLPNRSDQLNNGSESSASADCQSLKRRRTSEELTPKLAKKAKPETSFVTSDAGGNNTGVSAELECGISPPSMSNYATTSQHAGLVGFADQSDSIKSELHTPIMQNHNDWNLKAAGLFPYVPTVTQPFDYSPGSLSDGSGFAPFEPYTREQYLAGHTQPTLVPHNYFPTNNLPFQTQMECVNNRQQIDVAYPYTTSDSPITPFMGPLPENPQDMTMPGEPVPHFRYLH